MEKNNLWTESIRNSHRSTDFKAVEDIYPTLIPDLMYKKMEVENFKGPITTQFFPNELELNPEGLEDPIGDQVHQKTSMLIHRYSNRALFIPTTKCPINCRYCFRKNELSTNDFFHPDWNQTVAYLEEHTEIEELIFTGGDPFILSDEKIDSYLLAFSKIPHIKWVRFHTRTPIVMPERLTLNLKDTILKYKDSFKKMTLVLHINHADEMTPLFIENLKKFQDPSLVWLSQTVLLKDVNNEVIILKNLFEKLSEINISPYYLHHPDQVKGAMHFYLSIEEGRKIYSKLRDLLPGWLIPQYIIDIKGGFGKVPLFNPESFSFSGQLSDRLGQKREHQE